MYWTSYTFHMGIQQIMRLLVILGKLRMTLICRLSRFLTHSSPSLEDDAIS
ncbi:hypothetical protein HanXRQr2_Chr12g0532411 [Helianthus annuus]|uniref:Uncharacterized protein n=1 Tax=Helianthus annuus TaxID=4232 RepID=A0A251T3L3_HELAN|nr:hypothetical protein HanXRQr2_Chr12g0532411 [Helianthus annuus]KAJ0488751.1 hypothetical protein HanHA300_Chr12g0436331 [Helianthus annuus]KAJ0492316.1 hypothetical protein HanIR_Chr12g0573531 [Helianthus annuus]KAJ0504588.1 hypothetical protein HanHA89_Chr12g0460971 [Helianthus annuus]